MANKFNTLTADISNGVHNFATGQLVVALTNTLPVATNSVLTDITEINYTGLSSRNITTTSSTQTSGTYSLVLQDLVINATGTIPTWRYVVVYNSSSASNKLMFWYDRGSAVNMISGDSLTIDLTDSQTLFTIA
jgi:hypothetical protein